MIGVLAVQQEGLKAQCAGCLYRHQSRRAASADSPPPETRSPRTPKTACLYRSLLSQEQIEEGVA